GAQLLPPPPRLGLDRRDPDHGRPGGRRPIRGHLRHRARLPAGARAGAARAGDRRDRGRSRHRALHHRRRGTCG
ncbi:MAG: Phosphoenolpyruvate synthase regulatory protein, partial [uncultured Microvirga sp.]